ncbi:hypothetical protein BP6252_08127 [Coleophoma cylindrospora]|uniref:Cupin type-1 domain-containing protein n=1 Tax=Coleophoma cylindrospora TaxID=1849047 RepID=A0A3D8RCG7_9HELO|nr:hypothetical protein BP6252_08127 [Coleophoma cylindrospora]
MGFTLRVFLLLAMAVALLAVVEAMPVQDFSGLGARSQTSASLVGNQDAAKKAGTNAKSTAAKSSTVVAANAKTTAATGATATTIVDPNFDLAAATSAEKAAAASATVLAASANELKVSQLMTASTAVQKLDILSDDTDWKFDFNTEPAGANGLGGTIVTANLASFPVTQMTGSSMAIGVMGACGFATPHSHPRANELNLVTQGTLISTMTLENGARVINQTIGFQQMTVFPQGSMHMEYNPGCTNATFVAAFTSADAGVQQTMTAFTNFGDQVVQATMGGALTVDGKDIDAFKTSIPVNVALGVESCLSACGLKKRSLVETREVLKRGLQARTVATEKAQAFGL